MTREIKFRAWDKKNNEWLFGYELPNLGGFSMFGEIMLMGEWNALLSSRFPKDMDTIELMQFTGLHDKNGKEIYEGDILESGKRNKVAGTKTPSEVFWMGTHGIFEHRWNEGSVHSKSGEFWNNEPLWSVACGMNSSSTLCEVIGNIYENPELVG